MRSGDALAREPSADARALGERLELLLREDLKKPVEPPSSVVEPPPKKQDPRSRDFEARLLEFAQLARDLETPERGDTVRTPWGLGLVVRGKTNETLTVQLSWKATAYARTSCVHLVQRRAHDKFNQGRSPTHVKEKRALRSTGKAKEPPPEPPRPKAPPPPPPDVVVARTASCPLPHQVFSNERPETPPPPPPKAATRATSANKHLASGASVKTHDDHDGAAKAEFSQTRTESVSPMGSFLFFFSPFTRERERSFFGNVRKTPTRLPSFSLSRVSRRRFPTRFLRAKKNRA